MGVDQKKALLYCVALCVIGAVHTVINYMWLGMNVLGYGSDEIAHLCRAVRFYSLMTHFSGLADIFNLREHFSFYYPPLFSAVTASFIFLFGSSYRVIAMSNTVFLALLMVSIYLLAQKMRDEKAGLLAACMLSFYPGIFIFVRHYNLAIALTAAVTLSIYFLLVCDDFRDRKCSLFLGVSCAIGLFIKTSFLFYFIGPLAYVFYRAFRTDVKVSCMLFLFSCMVFGGMLIAPLISLFFLPFILFGMSRSFSQNEKNISKEVFWNFIIAFCVPVITVSWWYYGRFDEFFDGIKYIVFIVVPASEAPAAFYSWEALSFYPKLFMWLNSVFLAVIFIYGLIRCFREKLKNRYVLLYWILIAYVILTFMATKRERYLVPCMPPIAIISMLGLLSIKRMFLRRAAISFTALFVTVQFCFLTWDVSQWESRSVDKVLPYLQKIFMHKEPFYPGWGRPANISWREQDKELIRFLEPSLVAHKRIGIFTNTEPVGVYLFCRCMLVAKGEVNVDYWDQGTETLSLCMQDISSKEYDVFVFVSDTKSITWPDPNNFDLFTNYFEEPSSITDAEKNMLANMKDDFHLVKTIDLENDGAIFIWRRKSLGD